MVSYQYAVVRQCGTGIELQITDSTTIQQLLDKLSDTIPGFGASAAKLPGGDPYYWRFYGLGQDLETAWALIVEHFGSHGWTSLEGASAPSHGAGRTISFGLISSGQAGEVNQCSVLCLDVA